MLSDGPHVHTEQDIPLQCGCTVDIRYDKNWDPISGFLANICNDHLPPPTSE